MKNLSSCAKRLDDYCYSQCRLISCVQLYIYVFNELLLGETKIIIVDWIDFMHDSQSRNRASFFEFRKALDIQHGTPTPTCLGGSPLPAILPHICVTRKGAVEAGGFDCDWRSFQQRSLNSVLIDLRPHRHSGQAPPSPHPEFQ